MSRSISPQLFVPMPVKWGLDPLRQGEEGDETKSQDLTLVIAIEADKDLTENLALGHFRVFDRGKLVDAGFICPDDIVRR